MEPERKVDLQSDTLVGAPGYVRVRRVSYNGNPEEHTQEITVPVFHSDPARVRVSGGLTLNMGDYNSARIDVEVSLPCLPERSEIERAYVEASGIVSGWMEREKQETGGRI